MKTAGQNTDLPSGPPDPPRVYISVEELESENARLREECERLKIPADRSYQAVFHPFDRTITLEYATREAFNDAANVIHRVKEEQSQNAALTHTLAERVERTK